MSSCLALLRLLALPLLGSVQGYWDWDLGEVRQRLATHLNRDHRLSQKTIKKAIADLTYEDLENSEITEE